MSKNTKRCDICTYNDNNDAIYGEIISKSKLDVHLYCLLSGYNIPQNGRDHQGIYGFLEKDIITAEFQFRQNKCFLCKQKGAAVKCSAAGCERFWHFPCGRTYECITEFTGDFKSYCNSHVPDRNFIKHNGACCFVCFKVISEYHPASSIFSNCCYDTAVAEGEAEKEWKQKFVCNYCVQQYAYNAGYDAMCIMCSMKSINKKVWQQQMRLKGIFVPMKMAVWEDDPQFKEHVKNKCIHPRCPTPLRTANVWTCRVCGCHPLHLSCARVKSVNDYLCPNCFDQSFVQRVPLL